MKHEPLKQRDWLKRAFEKIEDKISQQALVLKQKGISETVTPASSLHQTYSRNNSLSKSRCKQADTYAAMNRSIDEIKVEERVLRDKLRQLRMMQKTYKNKFKDGGLEVKVKSNSQLRILTKKYRQFKKNLQEKTRLIQEQQQRQKVEAIKLKQEHMKSACIERRNKIEETLKQMQVRRKKRSQMLKLQRKKLKELKKQKLYQKMKQNFNKKANEQNQKKVQEYRRFRKQNSVDLSRLSTHQKKYDQLKLEKQEKRTVRMTQSRALLPQIRYYKSRFMENVVQEDRQRKLKQLQVLQMGKKIKERHKQYQDRVHEEFAPRLRENQSQKQNQDHQSRKVALQREELKRMGNEFHREGQKVTVTFEKHQQLQKLRLQLLAPQLPKPYPNYLSQFNHKSNKLLTETTSLSPTSRFPVLNKSSFSPSTPTSPTFANNKSSPISPKSTYFAELDKIKQIIKNEKMRRLDKLQQIRLIMEKIEYSYAPNQSISQQQMINRLNGKLEILDLLQEKGMRGPR